VPAKTEVKKKCGTRKNLETIQRTADKSITLLRNSAGLLPLNTIPSNARVSIIRPTMGRLMMSDNTNFYPFDFKDVFGRYFDSVSEYVVGLQPNETEILGASDWAFMTEYVIFCTYNAYKWPEQLKLLEACRKFAARKN
jgi:hypothetical protein